MIGRARLRRWASTGLVAAGLALLGATATSVAYGEYERRQVERAYAERERADAATATAQAGAPSPTATPAPPPTAAPTAAPAAPPPGPAPDAAAPPSATPAPAAATPRPTATPAPVRRVVAPAIGLDAPVVEARVVGGEWQVPKFAAGHLEGTAAPGQGGNVVLSGHLQSLTSGNVFARIDELRPGDEVTLRTPAGEARYRVAGKSLVAPDDLSVVGPTAGEELTLITCWGSYNPLTQDYTQRLVVWAERTG